MVSSFKLSRACNMRVIFIEDTNNPNQAFAKHTKI